MAMGLAWRCNVIRLGPSIFLALLVAGISSGVYAQKTTLTIQTSGPGKPISPDLVGIFFEDLNYAADGGLYAELVQNRSFEYSPVEQSDWHPLKFWDLQKRGGGDGSIGVAEMRPIHENNPHYALLTVRKAGDGVGIANSGFDGIPLQAGETYEASFWAYQAFMGQMWGRGDNSKPMPVTLRLEAKDGDVLAEASMQVKGREWRRWSANSGDTYLETVLSAASAPRKLAASSVRDSRSGHVIIKIVNGADAPVPLMVKLAGLAVGEIQATRTVLTGSAADAFNDDGQPPAVKPVSNDVALKPTFDYEAPANSLTVFRIRD